MAPSRNVNGMLSAGSLLQAVGVMLVLLAVTGDIYYEGLVNVIDSQASNVGRTHKRKKTQGSAHRRVCHRLHRVIPGVYYYISLRASLNVAGSCAALLHTLDKQTS